MELRQKHLDICGDLTRNFQVSLCFFREKMIHCGLWNLKIEQH